MAPFRPELLVKDELIFELLGRNITTFDKSATVEDLRKLIRQHRDVPFDIKNLDRKIFVNDELAIVESKITNLELSIQDLSAKSVSGVLRAETKHAHLVNRCNSLLKFKTENPDTEERCKNLLDKLVTIKTVLDNIVVEDSVKESVYRKLSDSLLEEEALDEVFKNIPSPVNNETSLNEGVPNLRKVESPVTNVVTSAPSCVNNLSSNLFSRLENPINNYLKRFKPTDGLQVYDLLDYLKVCIQLKVEMQLESHQVFELAVNYAQGPLLSKLLECKHKNVNLKTFHKEVLCTFLPVGLRDNLKRDLVCRPQKSGEHLSLYVHDIKMYAKILLCDYSECELVELIKYGICNEDRSKLVFVSNPTTFKELEAMCVQVQNYSYNDHVRNELCHVRPSVPIKHVNNTQNQRSNVRPSIKCFNCGRIGHKSFQCFQKQQPNVHQPKNL